MFSSNSATKRTLKKKLIMNSMADDKFSFPTINPNNEQASGFEFGCKIPDSPKSPADHLFFNGKLQPHTFPSQPSNPNFINFSRSTSSNGSMDSLLSSRSNSTGSSSTISRSSCSSARTSVSESSSSSAPDRKLIHQNAKSDGGDGSRPKNSLVSKEDSFWNHYNQANKKPVLTPHFSSSRRWQFITPVPVPALKYQSSGGRRIGKEGSNSMKENKEDCNTNSWFDGRFFKWFVSACLSCYTTTSINSSGDIHKDFY